MLDTVFLFPFSFFTFPFLSFYLCASSVTLREREEFWGYGFENGQPEKVPETQQIFFFYLHGMGYIRAKTAD
jgi:hypothetical protein